jgi:RHS repeat-associated protein
MPFSDQIPTIRTFQIDSSSIGELRNQVNQFRGDVNYTQKLFTMPGRAADQKMDVTVSIFYQSNVHRSAGTWNRDAPTSVLGLGWSLPVTYIELDDGGSPSPGRWRYYHVSNDIRTALVREPGAPLLFSMSSSLAGAIVDGGAVPSAIRSEFAERGIALGAGAKVRGSSSPWTIVDDDRQQLFQLVAAASALEARDGGESYQLASYKFWKILYYPEYERWVVTDESGQRLSFGGRAAPTAEGYATAKGNSVEWAVRWRAEDGDALWTGPSTLAASGSARVQTQYARAWRVAQIEDLWGDVVTYGYNEWPRTGAGLLPEVEQLVGEGGLPYTKACYLTSITDVFGRKAVFAYGDKLWDGSSPESPREYADPHKATPDTAPNAYQDRYETKYLCGITVQDAQAKALFAIDFAYEPRPGAGSASAVANVTSYSGSLAGDTYKRYLTGVSLRNADGDTLPGMLFSYHLDASRSGASPGALATITYPQGGKATYTYTLRSLPVCDRSAVVEPPSGMASGATPRVWFGPDYAVTTWYNAAQGTLSLVVYTWLGRWEAWQLDAGSATVFANKNGLDLSTLDVLAREDFFALHFQRTSTTDVYVFRKDTSRPGQWAPATLDGITTGCNKPTLSYSTSSAKAAFTGGDGFLIASVMDVAGGRYAYDRITWRWTTQAWTRESFAPAAYTYIAASTEYYFTLDTGGRASVFYLDPTLEWRAGGTASLSGFSVPDVTKVALVPGAAMVAASHLTIANSQELAYTIHLFRWDGRYDLEAPSSTSFTDRIAQKAPPTSWVPAIVNDTLVAVAGHALRFNGQAWLVNSSLAISNPPSGREQRYAYGPDYAVQIVVDDNGVGAPAAAVLAFDPDHDSTAWSRGAVVPAQALANPSSHQSTANWPSAGGGDYLTLGQYLYFRGTSSCWGDVVARAPLADLQALVGDALGAPSRYVLDAASVIDESPSFLAYFVHDTADGTARQTAGIMLKNGQIDGGAEVLADELVTIGSDPGARNPGMFPAGPSAFASYPDTASDFQKAPRFFLHRHAGDAIEGSLTHYAVTGIAIDDGMGDPMPTAFDCDPASAACDPSGLVVKYYAATAYPGTADPAKPAFGSTITSYLNGLEILTGANYYDMLDGLLHSVETRDSAGRTLERVTYDWRVFTQRAADLTDPSAGALNLKGGFVCQTAQTKLVDGVTSTSSTSYVPAGFAAPCSGQAVSTSSTGYGGSGREETFTTVKTYGYEVNEALRALHVLSAPAQTVTTWTPAGGTSVPTSASVTTYAGWPSALGAQVPAAEADFAWAGGASASFPFSSYACGERPPGWIATTRVRARTSLGLVREVEDGRGVVSSVLYGDQTFPVARFVNASIQAGQCAFFGFEPYESGPGFTVKGAEIASGDAHAGTSSLALPAGGAGSLSVTVTPANASRTYVLGYWYKTPAGFAAAAGTGWTVQVSVDGALVSTRSASFGDTGGRWRYATIGIPITAGEASIAITAKATNASGAVVKLDGVFLAPLDGGLTAQTFDPGYHHVTASMDASGRTQRSMYDRFQRVVASVGPEEQARELAQHFLSRQGSAGDAFTAASPNAEITLHPAGGGVIETFLAGDEWAQRWEASGGSARWSASDGELFHTAPSSDTLTWRGSAGGGPATAALTFGVRATSALAGPIGVSFGGGYRVAFDPDAGFSFTDPKGRIVQAPIASPPSLPATWLLVIGDGVVAFLGDGQLVYSAKIAVSAASAVAIESGPNAIAIGNLAFVAEPRLSVAYSDAAGRTRQTQQLHGGDARVLAILHDAIDRKVAVTRVAPASFGVDAALPLLAYRPHFADVSGFLAATSSSWELSGDVADYYRGQAEGAVQRSDDAGYPYRGIRFEASPRERALERGLPGRSLAIHDVSTTSPADRQTLQIAFGANSGGSLPAGDYTWRTLTTPLKAQVTQLKDTSSRVVSVAQTDAHGATLGQSAASVTYAAGASGARATLTMKLPNAFTSGPQFGAASYVTTLEQDPLGRLVRRVDPSTGATSYVYDSTNKVRFVLPAEGAGAAFFLYYRYDAQGRVVEEGTVAEAWDEAKLAALADDLAWPDASAPRTITRVHAYDGDGDDPAPIGRRVSAVTITDAGSDAASVVTETFAYDSRGRVASVTTTVSGAASATGVVGYAYNDLDEVTRTTLPEGAPLAEVIYAYDDQGRVISISSSAGAEGDLARYEYSADGELRVEARNGGSLVGEYQYLSPGWLELHTVTAAGADEPCFALGITYLADASMKGRTMTFAFDGASDATRVAYTYDGQRRLLEAAVADGRPGSESIGAYDANGNIWAATDDLGTSTFSCASGSDRLHQAALAGGGEVTFQYSADGRLAQSGNLSFAYDTCLAATTRVTVAGSTETQIRLAYGCQGQRVVKQVSGGAASARIYFQGSGQRPLAILADGRWTVLVHGPTGIVAVAADGRYFPLNDAAQTVWGLVDERNALAARYDYQPFGKPIRASGAAADVLRHRFTGQEWDPETGLYDFRARLYDPILRRFCGPDPARQFPSPYVLAGNDPLTMTDPTGCLSMWARVGIGVGMAVIAAAGLALSLCSLGISAEIAATVDGTLATLLATDVTAATVGATADVAATVGAVAGNVAYLGLQGAAGAIMGAGCSGLLYDYSHGSDFSAKDFATSIGIGAARGFATGVIGAVPTMPAVEAGMNGLMAGWGAGAVGKTATFIKLAQAGVRIAANGLASSAGYGATQLVVNGIEHRPWSQDLAMQCAMGFAVGAGASAAAEAKGTEWGTNLLEKAAKAAKSEDALAVYAPMAFLLVGGLLTWGTVDKWSEDG